jgi:xanthine dehydrogenase large subunit
MTFKNSQSHSFPHDSIKTHVTGQSRFIDDIPTLSRELTLGLITSTEAHAEIVKIENLSEILKIPGMHSYYLASDFTHNLWGTIFQDQPLLAEGTVRYFGEPIVILAAEKPSALREAKKRIQIHYKKKPAILTLSEAMSQKNFLAPSRFIRCGDLEEGFKNSEKVISGELSIQGQEHFYLEPQTALAIPEEQNRLKVLSSSQHPTEIQHTIAHALGLGYQDVITEVLRLGGGFGGKESQATPFAAYAALVAMKTQRPARLVLSRDEDMIITGKRNPFFIQYKVGFKRDSTLQALEVKLFSDSGAYADLSTSIMERAMLHVDNAYYIPNCVIEGTVCRTNHAPTTAFRGFGGPKGVTFIENIMEAIGLELNRDSLDVRKANVYQKNKNRTPYGQLVDSNLLYTLFENIEKSSRYRERRKKIEIENSENPFFLKGLSCTAVKFGISFTTRFLNQGAALVNIHTDGSVQVSTGAVEMGQGVNTKIAQVVAQSLGVDFQKVRVLATSTEKIHNTSPTAASSGADINGQAALQACEILKQRLAAMAKDLLNRDDSQRGKMNHVLGKVREIDHATERSLNSPENKMEFDFKNSFLISQQNSGARISLLEVIQEAYLHRIPLGALGFYRYPEIHFNKLEGQGQPFYYFTQGVAVSEVQVDRFTGETKVNRVDILMDLGRPLNQAIDRGQTVGAFVQGMGWVTTENLVYAKNGALLTHAPSTYKIPSIQDIPRTLNIDFLENDSNSKNIQGSKAVGEPPLLLGISVWTAIKNALSYKLEDSKKNKREMVAEIKNLPVPITQEKAFLFLHSSHD